MKVESKVCGNECVMRESRIHFSSTWPIRTFVFTLQPTFHLNHFIFLGAGEGYSMCMISCHLLRMPWAREKNHCCKEVSAPREIISSLFPIYKVTTVPPPPLPMPSSPPAKISLSNACGTRPSVMNAPCTPSLTASVAYVTV